MVGLFGTASSGRMLGRVQEAVDVLRQAGHRVQVLYIGPDRHKICSELGDSDIIADGPFPGEEVSRRLAAMDIYLAAYVDGISTRRGGLMAALQHGVATVGTRGPLTDSLLAQEDGRAFLLADVAAPEMFSAHVLRLAAETELRKQIAEEGTSLYGREFVWPKIVGKMQMALTDQLVVTGQGV